MKVKIENDIEIKDYTTFHVPAKAKYFATYSSEKELLALSRTPEYLNNQVLHIGGGSNLLFLSDYDGMILKSDIRGIREYKKDDNNVFAIVGAAETWDYFVQWCLDHNYGGVENLVMIPGEVGAAAVQNIGAYGVEVCDVIHSVECFDTLTREKVVFKADECNYGYRTSIFKNEFQGRYYVLRVSFKLTTNTLAEHTEYGPLRDLAKRLNQAPTIHEVAEEVRKVRESKLPDPKFIGSAGSFFKNPVVSTHFYEILKKEYTEIPGYEVEGGVKLSAAWLIDNAGFKNFRRGEVGTYPNQPLVLVNYGNATGRDVKSLADDIIKYVRTRFFLTLIPEVNIIDTSITVTVLGSGTSKGVPEIGCKCEVCQSKDKHDKRLRASIMIETQGLNILVDASPDFREQALRLDPPNIDALLITHQHFDHVGGIDDLRPFSSDSGLDIYLKDDVNKDLHKRLDYCFRPVLYPGVPHFNMHEVEEDEFYVKGVKITPIKVYHGKLPILGYRIGKFAYITDAKTIPAESMEKLEGLEVLIINALRNKDHFAHLTIEEALDIIDKLKPRKAYLTHFNHEAGFHAQLLRTLPKNVYPCYDGMRITIS